MARYAVFLRAVNVGGTGKLPMADLKAMCLDASYTDVQTYIASGNVVLSTSQSADQVRQEIESRLEAYAGKKGDVMVRTPEDLDLILRTNPFAEHDPKKSVVVFLHSTPSADALDHHSGRKAEELALGEREIYIYFPDGMGRSKLRLKAAQDGTTRNINTVRKIRDMAGGT